MNERQKRSIIIITYELLKLIYLYLTHSADEENYRFSKEVAIMIYNIQQENDQRKTFPPFEEYEILLRDSMKEEYPDVRKEKKIILKSEEELTLEATKVKMILSESSIIPEDEGILYHIVDMDWFNKWKVYSGYDYVKVAGSQQEYETPGAIMDDQSTTIQEDDNLMSDGIEKMNIHKDKDNIGGK